MNEKDHKQVEALLMFLTSIFAFYTVYETFTTLVSTRLWMSCVLITITYKTYYRRY